MMNAAQVCSDCERNEKLSCIVLETKYSVVAHFVVDSLIQLQNAESAYCDRDSYSHSARLEQ